MSFSKILRYISFEAKTIKQLEEIINDKAQGLTPLSIYFSNGRHYAWFSAPHGARRTITKVKNKVIENKKETVSL